MSRERTVRDGAAATTAGSASDVRKRLDVLVVEDTVETAELLEEFIAAFGHRARIAHCGTDALELVARQVPDIVLLDLGLPDMPGSEVAAAIRARFGSRAQIVALTGFSTGEERDAAERAGCDVFLTKPIHIPELEALLDVGATTRAP